MYCSHFRIEMMSSNGDKNEIEGTKKRVAYTGNTKESKKYGCVCT